MESNDYIYDLRSGVTTRARLLFIWPIFSGLEITLSYSKYQFDGRLWMDDGEVMDRIYLVDWVCSYLPIVM